MPDFVLSPLTWTLLLALLLCLSWRHVPRWLGVAGILLELALVVSMSPLGANVLVRTVEWRAKPDTACVGPSPGTIVLLSGGLARPASTADDYSALTKSSIDRLFAAIRLWRAHPEDVLVITGGKLDESVPESRILGDLALRMGMPADKLRTETQSQTTWENARNVAGMHPGLPRRIWLVSSALHLPRAMLAFRTFGFDPCPYSSGSLYMPFSATLGYFMPQTSALTKADFAVHELIGGWYYAWRARKPQSRGDAVSSGGQR